MAKRRRNRRNRRRPYRQSPTNPQPNTPKLIHNAVLAPSVLPLDNNSITTTPLNRNQSPVFTPIKNTSETPRVLRSNSLVLRKKINVESNGRARSNSFVTPKNIKVRNDLNCTNLNQLFEEKLRDSVHKNLKYGGINSNLLSEINRCKKFEDKPQNVEPIKMDVATQTVYFNRTAEESTYHVHSFAQIFETPKNCLNEVTIFTPPPCVASSTPIETFYRPEILANVARNMVHPKEHAYNYDFTTSHKSILKRDFNYHQSPIFDKNKIFSINKYRFYKTCSPRVARNAYVKINNTNKHKPQDHPGPPILHPRKPSPSFIIPKSFTPIRRCSLEKSSQNILNVSSGPAYGKIMTRIRSFHKNHTAKWIGKLLEVCQWFGITLKMGLSKFKKEENESPAAAAAAMAAICDCEKNKEKLANLETKLNQLETNHLNHVQSLTTNLQEVTSELSRIRTELAELVSMKTIHSGGDVVLPKVVAPAPPPPPPPMPVAAPPPPPPPPMPLGTNTPLGRGGIKINRANREEKKVGKEEARPVISLDDILKVKLKKPGERYQTPTLQRRNTQPVISMDMLRQVKLRPASRPQTPSFELSGGGVSGASLPTSPSSSLTRLLNKAAAESNANSSSTSRRLRPT